MFELTMLTEEAKRQGRFDFIWQVEGRRFVPVLVVEDGWQALRQALEGALQMHGVLDFGLAGYRGQ
jgi:hypothetical protein